MVSRGRATALVDPREKSLVKSEARRCTTT
jgi:hypothetical protein